jgi:hypothetical protein
MMTLRASPAPSASTKATHSTKSQANTLDRENATALGRPASENVEAHLHVRVGPGASQSPSRATLAISVRDIVHVVRRLVVPDLPTGERRHFAEGSPSPAR